MTRLDTSLDALFALPDAEAAEALNIRMKGWDEIERLASLAYVERGRIALEFERRRLWEHLADPATGQPFPSFNAWMSSGYIGCRSTNFEARRDVQALADIPAQALQGVPKSGVKVLRQLSSQVRGNPEVLAAAKKLKSYELANQVARDYPDQHLEEEHIVRLKLTRAAQSALEQAIDALIACEAAGTRSEAVERMAGMALEQVKLQREIEAIGAAE